MPSGMWTVQVIFTVVADVAATVAQQYLLMTPRQRTTRTGAAAFDHGRLVGIRWVTDNATDRARSQATIKSTTEVPASLTCL